MNADLTPLDILRHDGWCKGVGTNEAGNRCLGSAMAMLSHSKSYVEQWAMTSAVIVEQFPDRLEDENVGSIVVAFNDHPATTFADVETVLEKAQLRLAGSRQAVTAVLTPLDVLRASGWCKGRAENGLGEHCTIGALARSDWCYEAEDIVLDVITEQFPDRLAWTAMLSPVAQFNDHPDTTFADVELVLEKTQIRLDEQVQS